MPLLFPCSQLVRCGRSSNGAASELVPPTTSVAESRRGCRRADGRRIESLASAARHTSEDSTAGAVGVLRTRTFHLQMPRDVIVFPRNCAQGRFAGVA